MKSLIKRSKSSIFYKILIGFLLMVIPLYMLNLQMTIWSSNNIKQEISKSTKSQVHFYLTAVETESNRIIRVQRECLNDVNLQKLSITADVMTDYEKVRTIIDLQSQLQMLKNMSNYIVDVSAYIPLINRVISTNSSISNLTDEQFGTLLNNTMHEGSLLIASDDNLMVNINYPSIAMQKAKTPLFILSVELSKSELSHTLSKIVNYDGSGALQISPKNKWSLAAGANDNISNLIKNEIIKEINHNNLKTDQKSLKINGETYLVTYDCSDLLDSVLLVYIPERQILYPLKMYSKWIWIISIFSAVIIFIFSYWMYRLIVKPLGKLQSAFRYVEEGNFDINISHNSNDEFGYMYKHFNNMVKNLKQVIDQMYTQKIRAQQAELKQLQYQINPHFLYNSFFIIYRMAKMDDTENIMLLSQHLGNFYQYITRSSADEVPLFKEFEHTKDYIEIQTMRFSNRIKVELDQIPKEYENVLVPKLTLQPVIENCYKHGLKNKMQDGIIKVGIFSGNDELLISVEDNGDELDDKKVDDLNKLLLYDSDIETTGLINVHRRLKIKYGEKGGISISRSSLGGLKVDLHIVLMGDRNYV